ncbi:proteasome-type protease [Duganella radicis]|uniref:Peptidase n=1 Tax=Duganella radicis TaxID=551988 RepID=A0A6L6PCL6_9BURK|nr:proteasome-type protease [Duganella radicis]MTV36389.1 peptidase [Duganella radicis]
MTYCVGMRLNAGLVFLSDSRTNAGVDQVGTFRKLSVFEIPGDRMMVMMTAGNLSISQSIRQLVSELKTEDGHSIWNAPNMYEAARILGEAVRQVHARDAESLSAFGIEFNVSIIFGGQIKGERCRLFQIYSAGNFIESHDENTYFQIGEAKYGKPIIDRVVTPATTLDDAAKCALISMDSTLRSNVSVGLPLDLLVYEADKLAVTHFVTIDDRNEYFQMIRSTWGHQLKRVFEGLEAPVWNAAPETPGNVLHSANTGSKPVRVAPPGNIAIPAVSQTPLQTLSQQFHDGQQ